MLNFNLFKQVVKFAKEKRPSLVGAYLEPLSFYLGDSNPIFQVSENKWIKASPVFEKNAVSKQRKIVDIKFNTANKPVSPLQYGSWGSNKA